MNQQAVFQVSAESRRQDAAKAARANRASTKAALKSRASTLEVMAALEDFVPGVLNEEEQEWALTDPELAKFLAMCSQKELDRMRAERTYKAA
jgi:lipoate-protein ligase A